ncbi:hypothetical protein G4Y73_07975 [Wenzhouxiangella sp. XN201]|uniref:hypothetical protein n=1 Tax=Wenzhouxiangella sp. XN201 TaxID=2710755 RepID=UPI0013C8B631|nr:hypothetical protein [Wenzhouxiangella sp. XN201]NEZ04089.1 hypothetical protein [Wenzhouxiangella sp. XN201]
MKKTFSILSVLVLAVACGQSEEPAVEAETEAAQEQSTDSDREIRRSAEREEPAELPRRDQVDPEKKIPRMEGEAEEEGYGLTMVVDGSSPQAFQESLELIAMDTTSSQYQQLDAALRYLGTYDSSAWGGGMSALYKSLDGMTGEEIIQRAQEMRQERRNRQ